jgi:hypothetical protein
MITAVRLKPIDKRLNFRMATYVSAASRTKYTSGNDWSPSPFRLVTSKAELKELAAIPQFEIAEFEDMDALREHIQDEMEGRARRGLPAVRAQVMTGTGAGHEELAAKGSKRGADKLPAAANGPASDPTKTNTGRQPADGDGAADDDGDDKAEAPKKGADAEKGASAKGTEGANGKTNGKAKGSAAEKPKVRSVRPGGDD